MVATNYSTNHAPTDIPGYWLRNGTLLIELLEQQRAAAIPASIWRRAFKRGCKAKTKTNPDLNAQLKPHTNAAETAPRV